MKPEHFLYALPKSWYQTYGIRKYGFHGTSHHYLRDEYKKSQKKKTGKIITCHLGNGSSITLIENGKVIDTSM
jgi:acetate kinase